MALWWHIRPSKCQLLRCSWVIQDLWEPERRDNECQVPGNTTIDRTFSIVPPANPTTSKRPFHAIHFIDSNVSFRKAASTLDPWEPTIDKANRVIDDVYSFALSNGEDFILPFRFRVVDAMISTTISLGNFNLFVWTYRCNYFCPKRLRNLYSSNSNSSNSSGDQDPFTCVNQLERGVDIP